MTKEFIARIAALEAERADLLEALTDIEDRCVEALKLGATGPGYLEDIRDAARAAHAKAHDTMSRK